MARMQDIYEKKGYSKEWIDKRLRGIAVRQDLTDEWKNRGARNSLEFAILTNEIMQGTFDLKVEEYKQVKGLERENLRDHMTDIELILTMLAEATTTYIQRNYLKKTVIKHPHRAEAERVWNFPYAAVEEAVVNAVYHRSYEEQEPIEVRITPDELTVLSFPGPDRSISMEDLRAGRAISRRYRNRRIGEFLKELELTEGRSTGIPKIMKVMKDNGSPSPVFETDEDRIYFLIRLPVNPKGATENAPQVTQQVERLIATVER